MGKRTRAAARLAATRKDPNESQREFIKRTSKRPPKPRRKDTT